MDDDVIVQIVLCVTMVGAGLLVLWTAHAGASGRLRRNPIAGIRIPSTMASEEAWLAAHSRAKRPTKLGGLASIASGAVTLLPIPAPALAVVVLAGCVALLGFSLYGAHVGRRAANEVSHRPRD